MYIIQLQGKESIYTQIKKQITKFVELGVLSPHDKLPSVRNLAQDLGINPNTVQRAYAMLEEEGIIYTMNKKGAFVADKKTNTTNKNINLTVEQFMKDGVSKEELLKAIEDIYGGKND